MRQFRCARRDSLCARLKTEWVIDLKLCDIGVIREILSRHGFHFSKSLGQNFLCAPHVPVAIAEGAGIEEETNVLEVGPGIGTLTQELCKRAKKVVCVELDHRLPAVLAETLAEFDNVKVVEGDILKTDLRALCDKEFSAGKIVACANLPYYITTPAITALVDSRCFDAVTVMVQKEVARRICSKPGSSEYGAFTVYVQYHAQAKIILDVPAGCFIPAPKVDSAVVRLDLRKEPPAFVEDEEMFFRVVKAAFAQRRKTLLNCLRQGFSQLSREQLCQCLLQSGLAENVRGECLGLEEFAALAKNIAEISGK